MRAVFSGWVDCCQFSTVSFLHLSLTIAWVVTTGRWARKLDHSKKEGGGKPCFSDAELACRLASQGKKQLFLGANAVVTRCLRRVFLRSSSIKLGFSDVSDSISLSQAVQETQTMDSPSPHKRRKVTLRKHLRSQLPTLRVSNGSCDFQLRPFQWLQRLGWRATPHSIAILHARSYKRNVEFPNNCWR